MLVSSILAWMSFTCSKLNSQAASMGTAKRRRRHAPVNFISFSKARPGEWLSLTDLIWSSDCENSRREDYSKCSFDKSQGAPSMSLLFPMSQRQLTKGNSSQLIHTLCCQLSVLRFNWNYVWPVLNKIIYLGRTFTSPHLWRQNRKVSSNVRATCAAREGKIPQTGDAQLGMPS